jgi:hypothetical protein
MARPLLCSDQEEIVNNIVVLNHNTLVTSQNPGLESLSILAFSADVTATTRPESPLIAAMTSAKSLAVQYQ